MSAQRITVHNLDTGAEITTARLICDRPGCGTRFKLIDDATPRTTAATLRLQATGTHGWACGLGDLCDSCVRRSDWTDPD